MTALATDPVIRNWDDATAYLTKTQRDKVKCLGGCTYNSRGGKILQQWGYDSGVHTLSQLLQMIGDDFTAKAAKVYGGGVTAQNFPEIFSPRTLEDVNGIMASELAATMPISAVRDAAIKLGANPAAGNDKMRAVFAVWVSEWANAWGVILDDWIEYHKNNPDAKPSDMAYTAVHPGVQTGVTGSGKNFFEQVKYFVRHPLKVINSVISDSGKWVAKVAQDILNADKNVPWLSQYFLKPLGFHAQLTLLRELGRSIETGSISTFNEQSLVASTAGTLTAAGQALLVAAPLLPPPFNFAAAAVGALSVGAGMLINRLQQQSAAQRLEDERAGQQEKAVSTALNQEQQRQQLALAEYNAGRFGKGWFKTPKGAWYYGLWVYNTQQQPVPAWVWVTDEGWVWSGVFT